MKLLNWTIFIQHLVSSHQQLIVFFISEHSTDPHHLDTQHACPVYSGLLLVYEAIAAAQTSAEKRVFAASSYIRCSHASSSWVSSRLDSGTKGATRDALKAKGNHDQLEL